LSVIPLHFFQIIKQTKCMKKKKESDFLSYENSAHK